MGAAQAQGQLADAVTHLQHALRLQPDYIEAYCNLGVLLQAQGHVEAAIAAFERALQYKPDFVQAHWNRAVAWLLSGNFQQGWREYEWRWRRPDSPPPAFPQPRWDGTPFPHQTLLVYAEQGLGDTLQFVRYLPASQRAANTSSWPANPRWRVSCAPALGADTRGERPAGDGVSAI